MAHRHPTASLLSGRCRNLLILLWLALLGLPVCAQTARGAAAAPQRATAAPLPTTVLPEGFQIAGRRARLVQLPGQPEWFVVFPEAFAAELPSKADASQSPAASPNTPAPAQHADPFARPIEVLPCKWLAAMTKVVNDRVDLTVEFRIWGEITTYHKRNYILPTKVATEGLFGADGSRKEAKRSAAANSSQLRPGQKDARDGLSKAEKKDSPAPSELPDRLRRMLLAIPRTRPLGLPADGENTPRPDARGSSKRNGNTPAPSGPRPTTLPEPGTGQAALTGKDLPRRQHASTQAPYREGFAMVDRLGRLQFNRQAQTWTLLLEADDPTVLEPPLLLHPCRRLEVVENNTQGAKTQIMFRVSGHVTCHQGQNYLLLRKLLMVYDLGNFLK